MNDIAAGLFTPELVLLSAMALLLLGMGLLAGPWRAARKRETDAEAHPGRSRAYIDRLLGPYRSFERR